MTVKNEMFSDPPGLLREAGAALGKAEMGSWGGGEEVG